MGFGVSFASASRGQGAGDGTTFTNTQVSGETVQIESGGDTTLRGAVVQGEQVGVNAGGKLTIESQQDSSRYNESSKTAGFSVSVPITGANASASVNAGKTNINSNYQSVNEQTAIRAGDGGFQVNVAGNTTLTGGQLTSSDKAVQEGRNSFSTAGQTAAEAINSGALTLTDLNNSASFEASGVNIGVGVSRGEAKDPQGNTLRNPDGSAQTKTTPNNSAGFGQTDGAASSTTVAAISGLAGNTAARTGDAETGIKPIFNKDEVKQEINAQMAITAEFGKRASKKVGDHAQAQLDEAAKKQEEAEQARANGDNARAEQLQAEANAIKDNWGDNGKLRLAAHTAIGALTGGTSGAVGAASGTLTAPLVADVLRNAGVDETLASGLTALASTAVGAATGGSAGAAAAFNEVTNNFLSHAESSRRLQLQSEQLACKTDACRQEKQAEIDRLNRLDTWRDQQIEQACKNPASAACQSWTAGIQLAAKSYDGQHGNLVDTAERSSVLNQAFKYQQAVNNPFLHGVGTGLLKLTPPGIAVGTVGGVAAMVGHIQDRGLVDGMIDLLRGVADIPQNLRDRLNSPDPTVRGEAFVDVIALGSGVGVATVGSTRVALSQIEKAKLNSAIAKAEELAVAKARVDNNASADAAGLGSSAVREFKPGATHRAENINAGQVTDRDGLQRIDDKKMLNDAQVAQNLGLDKAPYYGTQRPAWMEGTVVQDKLLSKPETYRMVVNESEYEAIRTAVQRGDSSAAQRLGGWATKDTVTSAADVRGKLAISSEWKGQGGQDMYVIEFTVKPGVGVREGTVGPMFDARAEITLPGGGHQVQFMDKSPRTNPELYQINLSNSRKLK